MPRAATCSQCSEPAFSVAAALGTPAGLSLMCRSCRAANLSLAPMGCHARAIKTGRSIDRLIDAEESREIAVVDTVQGVEAILVILRVDPTAPRCVVP